MSRRMIDTSLWQNEKFTRMPLGARMLQIGIITHADDQGRAKANPSFLRMQIFPDDEDITNADIQKWLGLMIKNGTIISYTVDEKQYVQLCNWWKYQSLQYAAPSQFPRPDGWKDRIRKTVTKGFIATCNWQTVDGTQLEDTCDQDGNPLPKQPMPKGPPTTPPSGQSPNGLKPNQVVDNAKDNGHSPESPGGHSPESSPERTIELNRIELNRTEMNRKERDARETDESEVEKASLPLFQAKQDEYMPGVPDPRHRHWQKAHVVTAEQTEKAKALGLSAEQFRELSDIVLAEQGQKALVDSGSGDEVLGKARETVLELARLDVRFRTPSGISEIFSSWQETYPTYSTPPNDKQLKQHAGLILSGKIRKKVSQESPSKVDFTIGELLL